MRLPGPRVPLTVFAAFTLALALVAPAPAARAESRRTLRVELSAGALGRFAVENLAGKMHVETAAVKTVVAVATIHAESDDLAQKMAFTQVDGKGGVPTLRVRY